MSNLLGAIENNWSSDYIKIDKLASIVKKHIEEELKELSVAELRQAGAPSDPLSSIYRILGPDPLIGGSYADSAYTGIPQRFKVEVNNELIDAYLEDLKESTT